MINHGTYTHIHTHTHTHTHTPLIYYTIHYRWEHKCRLNLVASYFQKKLGPWLSLTALSPCLIFHDEMARCHNTFLSKLLWHKGQKLSTQGCSVGWSFYKSVSKIGETTRYEFPHHFVLQLVLLNCCMVSPALFNVASVHWSTISSTLAAFRKMVW